MLPDLFFIRPINSAETGILLVEWFNKNMSRVLHHCQNQKKGSLGGINPDHPDQTQQQPL